MQCKVDLPLEMDDNVQFDFSISSNPSILLNNCNCLHKTPSFNLMVRESKSKKFISTDNISMRHNFPYRFLYRFNNSNCDLNLDVKSVSTWFWGTKRGLQLACNGVVLWIQPQLGIPNIVMELGVGGVCDKLSDLASDKIKSDNTRNYILLTNNNYIKRDNNKPSNFTINQIIKSNNIKESFISNNGRCGSLYGHCPDNQCCSLNGYCGISTKHCNHGCQNNYGVCKINSSNTTTLHKSINKNNNIILSKNKNCGLKNGIYYVCPNGTCCSEEGKCGFDKYSCGKGCQPQFGKCGVISSEPGYCGEGVGLCPEGQCCSKYGYCGTGKEFCQINCQIKYGKCFTHNEEIFDLNEIKNFNKNINNTTINYSNNNEYSNNYYLCGKNAGHKSCPKGFCCSKNGYCGVSDKFCGINNGCQFKFGSCKRSKYIDNSVRRSFIYNVLSLSKYGKAFCMTFKKENVAPILEECLEKPTQKWFISENNDTFIVNAFNPDICLNTFGDKVITSKCNDLSPKVYNLKKNGNQGYIKFNNNNKCLDIIDNDIYKLNNPLGLSKCKNEKFSSQIWQFKQKIPDHVLNIDLRFLEYSF